tara:strand:+ start:94 stop:636 length:543 start_codon:yes stop_codon:yes gene_type:complete
MATLGEFFSTNKDRILKEFDKYKEWSKEKWESFRDKDDTEEKKAFEKEVTEVADKTIDKDYDELSKDEQEAYDVKRYKIWESMKAEREKEEIEGDKELAKKIEGIKEVINTFEDFSTGESARIPEWEGEIADPYEGTTVLSDLQQKENQKALLAQITGYTSPMQRAVDLEKRLTNLVKYT